MFPREYTALIKKAAAAPAAGAAGPGPGSPSPVTGVATLKPVAAVTVTSGPAARYAITVEGKRTEVSVVEIG
jgi:hypothetical protein